MFYIYAMSQHPLRQPHNKEQPKLKAKQNTRGKRSFTYPVDLPGSAGSVLLWPWYRYFSKEKVSLSVVQSLIISHTERGRETGVGTGRKCTTHRPPPPSSINLHRPLPGHRLGSAKTPPFLVNWPPIRGPAWSRSSPCLETSGPSTPRRCGECRSWSRSRNLNKETKIRRDSKTSEGLRPPPLNHCLWPYRLPSKWRIVSMCLCPAASWGKRWQTCWSLEGKAAAAPVKRKHGSSSNDLTNTKCKKKKIYRLQ